MTNTRPLTSAEVDEVFAAVDEGVKGPDDIVAVHAQIEREVVAGAGWNAGIRKAVFGGRRRHNGLGAVPAGRREPVGTRGNGVPDELLEIVAAAQLDGPDPRVGGFGRDPTLAAFPPPDHGLTNNTGRCGGRDRKVNVRLERDTGRRMPDHDAEHE